MFGWKVRLLRELAPVSLFFGHSGIIREAGTVPIISSPHVSRRYKRVGNNFYKVKKIELDKLIIYPLIETCSDRHMEDMRNQLQ